MKSSHLALVFPVLMFIGSFNIAQSQQTPEIAAQKAAESWMRLMDSRKYGEAWDASSQHLKERITKRVWEMHFIAFDKELKELWDTKSRQLVKAELIKSLPSVLNQEGVILKYKSSFEGHEPIDETVEMVLGKDEEWRVANYTAISITPIYKPAPPLFTPSKPDVETTVDTEPVLLNRPEPRYTEAARKNRIEGVVIVRVLVGSDGKVKEATIKQGLPYGLDTEAFIAIFKLRYKPGMKNSQPVAYRIDIEIEFKLEGK